MRIPMLIYKVLDKVSPMPSKDVTELQNDATIWFDEKLKETQVKVDSEAPLGIIDKVLLQSETWYFRTACAIAYIILVSWIQRLMNPYEDDGMNGGEPLD